MSRCAYWMPRCIPNIPLTSLAMVVTPSVRPAYLPGSVCKRVFTTSSGMTVRWVDVHPTAPHAAKSAKSTAVRLRSCESRF